jgi:hypothetical protein
VFVARNAMADLAQLEPRLVADTEWLSHLATWRQIIADELLALPRVRTRAESGHQQNLTLSLTSIDRGLRLFPGAIAYALKGTRVAELMQEAGFVPDVNDEELRMFSYLPWRGSTPEVEDRIADLRERIDRARRLRDDALLTDDERAARNAEAQAFRDALNSMNIQTDATGTGLVAFTKQGAVLDVGDMTPAQRAAFERFAAAHSSPQHHREADVTS